jgi:hypothetical protein
VPSTVEVFETKYDNDTLDLYGTIVKSNKKLSNAAPLNKVKSEKEKKKKEKLE